MNRPLSLPVAFLGVVIFVIGAYLTYRDIRYRALRDTSYDSYNVSTPAPTPTPRARRSPRKAKAVKDLSATYGLVGTTIFNKKTKTVFYRTEDFLLEAGVESLNGLKFDEVQHLPDGVHFIDGRPLTPDEKKEFERTR